ncbi:MAG TPA: hypothetical protein VM165_14190 [Planctomycetaceae bacterium]|nr:hypothetical protein [Planctomycetaceae bacterium]
MGRGPRYTAEEDATILKTKREHDGKGYWAQKAADATGRSVDSVMNRYNDLLEKGENVTDTATHNVLASKPLSLDEVIKLWDIDTDIWEAQTFTPRRWEIGAKHPETGEILTKPLHGTLVVFKRKKTASIEIVAKQILADIEAAAKRKPTTVRIAPKASDRSLLLELDVFDLHVGKMAWGAEAGADYDLKIAERIAKAAVSDLLGQIGHRHQHIAQILLPFGNDFFQYDTPGGTTTAGTQVDHDGRYQKMFRVGHLIAMWMIEECLKIAPVHIPVVPGNHDEISAFSMGMVLEAEYRREKRVTFDNGPAQRKYYRWGKTLLGFTHGDKEKIADLPGLMTVEKPHDWAASTCREFHIGHFHHGKKREPISVEDMKGCTVRWLRSLSASDSWHHKKGFVGTQRSAEAFLWRKEGAFAGHFVSLPVEELVA